MSNGGAEITISNIAKVFRTKAGSKVEALAKTSLEVRKGEAISIVGPSGCGKSTMLMMVAGLLQPSEGMINIDGKQVTKPTPAMGIAFQRDNLFEWKTVRNNVLTQAALRGWPARNYLDRADALLAMVGLEESKDRYPREVSGGMRQRTALCRALVHEPTLLLLDEPFAAVDALTRERLNIEVSVLSAKWSSTILMVTHDVNEAVFMGDRVVVLSPAPGAIAGVVDVAGSRPRDGEFRKSDEYTSAVIAVRECLEVSGAYNRV